MRSLKEKFTNVNGSHLKVDINSIYIDLPVIEFELEVSKVYLKKLQEEKEKNKKNPNSLSNKMNTLSLSMNPGANKGGIPGLKKK